MIRNPEFLKIRTGKPFSINRPAFLEGTTTCNNSEADEIPRNRRTGVNNGLERINFLAQPIAGRLIDFETPIQTGLESLNLIADYLIVKDVTDEEWTAEESRLRTLLTGQFTQAGRSSDVVKALVDKELSINKPLNRDQRTIRKLKEDITDAKALNFDLKLQNILQEVKDNSTNVATNTTNIVQLLQQVSITQTMTQTQTQNLSVAIGKVGLPKSHRDMGLVDIFGNEYFKANQGMVLLYMLNNYQAGNPLVLNMLGKTATSYTQPSALVTAMSTTAITGKIKLNVRGGITELVKNEEVINDIKTAVKTGEDLRYNFDFTKEFNKADRGKLSNGGVDITKSNMDQSTLTVSIKTGKP